MLAARPHIEPRRTPTADSVLVKEIYLSVQGESSHAGLLCSFVRLTGCHLRCTWCDSEFSFRGGTRLSNSEVVAQVKALRAPLVEVTGGEPLLQPGVYPLMEALLAEGLTVLLDKPFGLLFSTVFGKLHPRELSEWIIEDRLPVRFQLQLHKYVWDPNARGV
jgi:7-carboxy-7-deazaguanine synthase